MTDISKCWATIPTVTLDPRSFQGRWSEKYWRNVPGPIYSTTLNMMSGLAFGGDEQHLLFDYQCEFVWRQPITSDEYKICLSAIDMDEVNSYQVDGNKHWTPQLVREWWGQKSELESWPKELLARPRNDSNEFRGLQPATLALCEPIYIEYLKYINTSLPEYLRSYLFLLETGRAATSGDTLPNL